MQTQHKVELDDRDQGGRVPQAMAVSWGFGPLCCLLCT
jgi:hypothetical protein